MSIYVLLFRLMLLMIKVLLIYISISGGLVNDKSSLNYFVENKLIRKIKKSIIIILIFFFIDIVDMILENIINTLFKIDHIFIEIISFFIILILYLIIRKNQYIIYVSLKQQIVLLIFSFVIGLSIAYTRLIIYKYEKNELEVISIFLAILWIILLLFLFFVIKTSNDKIKNKLIKENEKQISENKVKFLKMVIEKNCIIKEFKHDFDKHIKILRNLIMSGKYDMASKYILDLNEIVTNSNIKIFSGNILIDMIIKECINVYPEKNIEFTLEGLFPEEMNISDVDLCTLFSNLIINSFEAAANSVVGYVNIKTRYINNTLYVLIENSFIKNDKNNYISKVDSNNRGYGLKSAMRIIKKHKAILRYEIKEDHVLTKLLVNYK